MSKDDVVLQKTVRGRGMFLSCICTEEKQVLARCCAESSSAYAGLADGRDGKNIQICCSGNVCVQKQNSEILNALHIRCRRQYFHFRLISLNRIDDFSIIM